MGSHGWVKDLIHELLYLYKSLLYIQLNICKQIPLKLKGTFLHCDTGLDDTVLFLVGGRNKDLGSRWSLRNFVSQSRPPLPIAVGRTICFFYSLRDWLVSSFKTKRKKIPYRYTMSPRSLQDMSRQTLLLRPYMCLHADKDLTDSCQPLLQTEWEFGVSPNRYKL